jgi:hypothetical protein
VGGRRPGLKWARGDAEIAGLDPAAPRHCAARRPIKGDLVLSDGQQQLSLAFVERDRPYQAYEYAVLVTNLDHELLTLGPTLPRSGRLREQLRRAQKPVGLGRLHQAGPASLPARGQERGTYLQRVELVSRLANPKARLEAITSRPFLLYAIFSITTLTTASVCPAWLLLRPSGAMC